jgi:hypothetical protein
MTLSASSPFDHIIRMSATANTLGPSSISKDKYKQWQKEYTFAALRNRRYGESFCQEFNITDNRLYFDSDWKRCDQLIRREWIDRH